MTEQDVFDLLDFGTINIVDARSCRTRPWCVIFSDINGSVSGFGYTRDDAWTEACKQLNIMIEARKENTMQTDTQESLLEAANG